MTNSNGKPTVNAFQWREYMAEERAKMPKVKKMADPTKISMTVSRQREKQKNDKFGTIPWLVKTEAMLKPREFLVYSRAGTK